MHRPDTTLEIALSYAERGYPVFPCQANGKSPLTRNGFYDASVDEDRVRHWWTEMPYANVAMATAGLLVIDVDGAENPWPHNSDRAASLLHATIQKTPRGGKHYFFRRPEGKNWRCTSSELDVKVDVRTNGGYALLWPSITIDGHYDWLDELPPIDQLPYPPQWLCEAMDALDAPTPILRNPEAPIIEGQRNDTLARIAGSMRRVGMSESAIAAALHVTNRTQCSPSLPDKEVDKIAASIARYEPDIVWQAVVEGWWENEQNDPPPEALEEDNRPQDPGIIPDELLHIPGFINELTQYTLSAAPYPNRVLAFCGALSLLSLLTGRKVQDSQGNRTNLYLLGLANSGVGKDHPRKVNANLLHQAGLSDWLGTSFASGEGLEDSLQTTPAMLYQVDEIDGMLWKISQSKDAKHESIVSMLLKLYSSADTIHTMRAKAGQPRQVIDQPFLTLYGTAVPKHFYESLSKRMLTNGFVPRMLVLHAGKRGEGHAPKSQPIPESLLEYVQWWGGFQPGGNLATHHPSPKIIQYQQAATDVLNQFRASCDGNYQTAEQEDDTFAMAVWARAYEKCCRLAILYAVSHDRTTDTIDEQAACWATSFVEYTTRLLLYGIDYHSYHDQHDQKRKELLAVLHKWKIKHGEQEFMPYWAIRRKLPWSTKEHDEIRDTLIQQVLIEVKASGKTGKGGRGGITYRLL